MSEVEQLVTQFTLALVFVLAAAHVAKGHFCIVLVLLVVSAYELIAPAGRLLGAPLAFQYNEIDSSAALHHVVLVVGMILAMSLAYHAVGLSGRYSAHSEAPKTGRGSSFEVLAVFGLLLALVLLLGSIALVGNAGETLLEIYVDTDAYEARPASLPISSLGYGRLLLWPLTAAGIYLLLNGRWGLFALLIVLSIPLTSELFIAGRRQVFAPPMLLAIAFILYRRSVRWRSVAVALVILLAVALAVFQYSLRLQIQDAELDELTFAELLVLPLLAEATTSAAININAMQAISGESVTYGSHLVRDTLDGIPFFRLGRELFVTLGWHQWDEYRQVAPYGGFSMLADAWLSFREAGVLILGMLLGIIARYWHIVMRRVAVDGQAWTSTDLINLGLLAGFVALYRAGIGDFLRSLVPYLLLVGGTVIVSRILVTATTRRSSRGAI